MQKPIVESYIRKEPVINIEGIHSFLEQIDNSKAKSAIDFETYSSAVPEQDGHSPFQVIPIQFSSGIILPSGNINRYEYIATSMPTDSREFAETLLGSVATEGNVLAWYAPFEKGVISRMAEQHPDLSTDLLSIHQRIVDLMEPFKYNYLDHRFQGQTKLKKVAPVLVPELDYSELAISSGSKVGSQWKEMITTDSKAKRNKLLTDLQKYCALDTTCLLRIYQFLVDLEV